MDKTGGSPDKERIFQGIGVSPGAVWAPVVVLDRRELKIPSRPVEEDRIDEEIRRFQDALVRTRSELQQIQKELSRRVQTGEESIFEAQEMVLEDPAIIEEVVGLVKAERINVEEAFHRAAGRYAAALEDLDDSFLRERASDIRDVAHRVLSQLIGERDDAPLARMSRPSILVARDPSPSLVAMLDREKALGLAIDAGSRTSHTAILARSLQIPAVVGLGDASSRLAEGDKVLLDGYSGMLILEPGEEELQERCQMAEQRRDFERELASLRSLPARTADGATFSLMANLDHPEEAGDIETFGAEGVGLFRTEYLFLGCRRLPGEEEQFQAYREVVRQMGDRPLTVRTLDLGTDKMSEALPSFAEANPALGVRAIRLCLLYPDLFRTQIRAILRASAQGPVRLLFPMISSLEELRRARELLEGCREDLEREGVPFDRELEVGIMIETPAAAMIAGVLAREADFFSIGTNDLVQYGAAVDRGNERVAHLYEPSHPGILRLIRHALEAAAQAGIPAGICGEMAGYPVFVPLLLGLGVPQLSASAPQIPAIKHLIRRLRLPEARQLAQEALEAGSAAEVTGACRSMVLRAAPELADRL